jgi:hypothetical protein
VGGLFVVTGSGGAGRIGAMDDIAARINAAHEAVLSAAKAVVERAIEAGELVLAQKARLAHGQWLPWLAQNCPSIHPRMAQRYMRLAENRATLEAKTTRVSDLSLRGALKLIDDFPASDAVRPGEDFAPEPAPKAKSKRPKMLEEAWQAAPKRARREFVKYYAYEIEAILDSLGDENPTNADALEELTQ